jgi:cytochrome c oxidase subunit 3
VGVLVTEIMFFGGLFMAYILYRYWYPDAWAAASNHLNVTMGAANTLVLIVSSVTMVLAVRSAQIGSFRGQITWLIATIMFGATFLVVKYFEYAEKFEHHLVPGAHFAPPGDHIHAQHAAVGVSEQLFFSLYFIMTGIHAAHMVVGIGIMLIILAMAWKKRFSPSLLRSGGSVRPLLALRRHRVDFPVPVLLFAGRAPDRRQPLSLRRHVRFANHHNITSGPTYSLV